MGEQRGNSRSQGLQRRDWRVDGAPGRGDGHRLTVCGLSPSGRHGFLEIAVIGFKIYMRRKTGYVTESHRLPQSPHDPPDGTRGLPGSESRVHTWLHVCHRVTATVEVGVCVCGFPGISQPLGAGRGRDPTLQTPTVPSESVTPPPLRRKQGTQARLAADVTVLSPRCPVLAADLRPGGPGAGWHLPDHSLRKAQCQW